MYLKRLELQGFKSFAPRSALEFSPGITAIVGPNGSGKSNVADAIRWVLGEQSMRQLRGKKSDDVLFAGGQGRAAAQMAEVTLVLDNTTAWLPSERTEVTATRRSFRSGETEYLINGQRVRLRDLLLLLAQARIGHDSYTVVGQGLIDQALSLRAEERRGLFEDAAGIRQFQARRTEAEQKLALTQTNLGRLRDIIAEIEPRLGPLAEQARRAREHATAREELRRQLRAWYTLQWGAAQTTRARAEAAEAAVAEHIEALRTTMAMRDERIAALRPARDTIIARLNDQRRTRGETAARAQILERDLAVNQERRASLERQATDLAQEHGQQEERLASAQSRAAEAEDRLRQTEEDAAVHAGRLETLERGQHAAQREREREEARLRAAQRDALDARAHVSATQTDLARLNRQRDDRAQALDARQAAVAAAEARSAAAGQALTARTADFDASRQRVEELVGQRDALAHALAEGERAIDHARGRVADAKRERRAAADRLALLEEWRRNLDDYPPGVREVLRLPASERPAIAGVLAGLIHVAEGRELAVEAALGPFLHALVTADRDAALACADWLRARRAGHGVIVWLADHDGHTAAVEPAPPVVSEGGQAAYTSDVVSGPIERVIHAAPELRPLLARLLTGTTLTPDLAAVVANTGEGSASVPTSPYVTVGGELIHPIGWIRGGAPSASSGEQNPSLLERERALRELPGELERRDSAIAALENDLGRAELERHEHQEQLAPLANDLRDAEAAAKLVARDVAGLQREAESAASDLQLCQLVAARAAEELTAVDSEVETATALAARQEGNERELQERVADVQADLDALMERNHDEQEELARERTALALCHQEAKATAQAADQAHLQVRDLESQIQRRGERMESFQRQSAEVEASILEQQGALDGLRARAVELTDGLRELETTLRDAEGELSGLDREREDARREVERLEIEYRQRIVEAQRARDSIDTLVTQLREEWAELGDAATEGADDDAAADPLAVVTAVIGPMAGGPSTESHQGVELAANGAASDGAPSDAAAEEAVRLRRHVDQLRARLRHLGGYDPDAPQIYEELKARHAFLNAQVRDMEQASVNLRTVIAELDATMRRQFTETFHAVNLRFQRHFTNLFSGGSARLELTAPRRTALDSEDDDSAEDSQPPTKGLGVGGVEVYVQIPGKRVQDLALLSGGERSMVSAALLFALLETNPPPFCLLDEVDAALDEANVVRFCETLRVLAERTQFIVITHNRVTMTHAGAIYGVSMGADSISRMLSMRLAEVPVTR